MSSTLPSQATSRIAAPGMNHGQRRRVVTELLLAEIFQGRLTAGQRLVIRELADRFQVSPSPVREALVALEAIGLVDIAPNRGAIVRRVTKAEVKEICQVRRALECEATRLASGRIALERLHALSRDARRLQQAKQASARFFRQAREIDSRLHDLIANSCGNAFLAQELNRLKTLFRAFRDVSYQHSQARDDFLRLAEEAGEHLAVIEALIEGDGKQAARAMARHIGSGVKYWSRALPTS